MRIVIDTNVIISGIFFGGNPSRLIELVYQGDLTAVASPEIVNEYEATAHALLEKYHGKEIGPLLTSIISHIEIIEVSRQIKVCRDPDDDKFVECAVDGKCLYIVSGDKDLLSIKNFDAVEILTVTEFFERFPK